MVIQEKNLHPTFKNNNLCCLLFAFGAIAIIVGIYLSAYSTVVVVNQSFSIPYMISYSVPLPTQIYPYQSIGTISILSAMALIGIALFQIRSK